MRQLSIRETQEISLEILKQIADICEKEGFRYYLIYGTLIGAIRHKGYIPWDDDVDIMMPRDDYEKFLAYFKKHKAEFKHLKLFNRDTCKKYPYMISRVSDDRYMIDVENEDDYGMGVFVDIYPYDGLGNTVKEAKEFGLKGDRLSSLCYQASRQKYAVENTKSTFRKILKFPVFFVSKLIGKDYFQRKLKESAGLKSFDDNKYVGCFVWLSGGIKDIHKREWFDDYVVVPFEKYEFRVPAKYHEMLRHGYGDYMQLPPENERIGHHYYKVYEK